MHFTPSSRHFIPLRSKYRPQHHQSMFLLQCQKKADRSGRAERSEAWTVFARSNTAIVGSNPTEAWMFVCVFSVSTVSSETASRPNKQVSEDLSLDKPLHVIYKVSKLAYEWFWVILIANERVKKMSENMRSECNISTRFTCYIGTAYCNVRPITHLVYAGILSYAKGEEKQRECKMVQETLMHPSSVCSWCHAIPVPSLDMPRASHQRHGPVVHHSSQTSDSRYKLTAELSYVCWCLLPSSRE
jgi:hypothetical protein